MSRIPTWLRTAALVPGGVRDRIDAVRNQVGMRLMEPANREFVRRHGLTVSGGPFAGMRYLPGLEATQGDLVSKLLGRYESELQGGLAAWRQEPLSLVVNVGCAEGYYAVGLALAFPGLRVLAYDIDPAARELCMALAGANGVADRVEVHGECTPATLAALPADGVALLCDCEGYELTLLDPQLVPGLRRWSMIVELHDQLEPTITGEISRRFAASHEVELIESAPAPAEADELAFMSARQRRLVLSERPVAMRWARLAPRR
jgi:hypothetical protein